MGPVVWLLRARDWPSFVTCRPVAQRVVQRSVQWRRAFGADAGRGHCACRQGLRRIAHQLLNGRLVQSHGLGKSGEALRAWGFAWVGDDAHVGAEFQCA